MSPSLKWRLMQAEKPLSSELLREYWEAAVWSAQRNLWTCKEVLEYAKTPEDREGSSQIRQAMGRDFGQGQEGIGEVVSSRHPGIPQ